MSSDNFGSLARGDWMDIRKYSGVDKKIGTHEPSYYLNLDSELHENPDGTLSGGSVDWSIQANAAYVNTFGNASAILARNAATTFSGSGVVATGSSTLEYGPHTGEHFTFATKYIDDGSFWFDLDGSGVYETHGIETAAGISLDLDFNGTYETPMVDLY